jgi:hypothetical protein
MYGDRKKPTITVTPKATQLEPTFFKRAILSIFVIESES